jgi:hypothetical protein
MITAAYVRRLARDTGNQISAHDVDVALVASMTLGVPTGTAAAERVADHYRRLWKHTENKIHRKCSNAEAAAVYPGTGTTTALVTDDLFNLYGIPWVSALRSLSAPYGKECTQVAILQAGYAARDQIRRGNDYWDRYKRLVDRVCPNGLFDEIEEATWIYLFDDLDGLRQ